MRKALPIAWLLSVAVFAAATLTQVRAQPSYINIGANLVVIVSAQSPVRSLSFNVVRDIFLGVPTYIAAGEPYMPMTQPPKTPVRTAFDMQFLGLDPDAVGRYWIDQRIRARVTPPRTIASIDTLRKVVAGLPRAISYIRADELQPGIVPVKIDGIDFRSPSYRYRMSMLIRGEASGTDRARF